MMKKIILLMIITICGLSTAFAQGHGGKNRRQMMKELTEFKMKYLAQEMDLDDEQKEKFSALFYEMSEKRLACMREAWKLERKVRKSENATEADYEAAAEAMNKAKAEDVSIEKEYDNQFSQFLTPKQIFKMKAAEKAFNEKMREMRHKAKRDKK